jgi:hypothetical protein
VSISEHALVQVSTTLDVERAKVNATRQVYLNMMKPHTAHGKHVLDLGKILAEKKVKPNGRE